MRTLLFLCAAGLLAQEPLSIKVDVRLVNVAFIVRDQSGALASGLTKDDFEILEDGVPQEIHFFGRSADLPLRLALMIDVSGSQAKFNKQHLRDIGNFLAKAVTSRDRATLVRFGDRIRVVTDFTPSPAEFLSDVEELRKDRHYPELAPDDTRSGGTALFDTICATAGMKQLNDAGERKALLLFSDGEDNSSAHDLIDAIEAAQTADAPIYTVRYTESKKGRMTARNRYGVLEMDRLATETGGAAFDASQGDVAKSLARVAEELRSMYDVGFVSSHSSAATGYRKVEIRVKQPGFTVRSKPGYYAH